MALMLISQPSDQKPRNSLVDKKPTTFQLKDYLQDDFGSCSSNGFRSFPRRQCCAAAARNLIDLDSSSRSSHHVTSSKRFIRKMSRSKSSSSKITCALHRASMAVINAVKLLPFRSSLTNTNNSLSQNKSTKKKSSSILMPRTLSRRLFSSRSFWRRSSNLNTSPTDQIIISSSSARSASVGDDDRSHEIEKWISSAGKYVVVPTSSEDHHLSNSNSTTTSLSIATITTTATTTTTCTTTTTESSNTSDDCWSESDSVFALITPRVEAVHETKIESGTTDGCGDGVIAGDHKSIETATMKNNWENVKEEKEQLSPVSVLDFPDYYCYDYKQESSTSPFSPIRRFGCLSNLHPVNLESMLSLSADDELEPEDQTTTDDQYDQEEEFVNSTSLTIDQERLLEQIIKDKNSSMSLSMRCEFVNLLLGFFEEGMERASRVRGVEDALMKEAEDWLRGTTEIHKLSQGWNDEEMRGVYVKGTEQGGDWRCVVEEKDEIVVDLEGLLLASLVDELVVEMVARAGYILERF